MLVLLCLGCLSLPASATKLTPELSKAALSALPGRIRLDGAVEAPDGKLYLLLIPPGYATRPGKGKVEVDARLPSDDPGVVFYSNGCAHLRLLKQGDAATLVLPRALSEKQKRRILSLRLPSDLIAPVGFVLPKSLKPLGQDVPAVSLVDDDVIAGADFGRKRQSSPRSSYHGDGSVFLTSIKAGSITMLNGKSLNKIAEFPTEGTPCGMELVNGLLYVVDEAKNRVLTVDPSARKFVGQIDLPDRAAPKGIAAFPDGKWIYVSESGANDVVVLETATGKPLVKTKVRPGPGKMAITPDGVFLVVLNVTSGQVSLISTYNQKVISTIKVGDMPTSLALAPDGKTAFVGNRISNTVSVIELEKHQVVGTIKCGQSPTGIGIGPDGSRLYVATGRDNTLTEYDTRSLAKLRELRLSSDTEFPGSLCMLPGGHKLLISSQGTDTDSLSLIDIDKFVTEKSFPLGHANNEAIWVPAP
jgi:YVTN family beta-propeller protein